MNIKLPSTLYPEVYWPLQPPCNKEDIEVIYTDLEKNFCLAYWNDDKKGFINCHYIEHKNNTGPSIFKFKAAIHTLRLRFYAPNIMEFIRPDIKPKLSFTKFIYKQLIYKDISSISSTIDLGNTLDIFSSKFHINKSIKDIEVLEKSYSTKMTDYIFEKREYTLKNLK